MKILLDFLPIAIFVVAYFITKSFITATAILIPATILQVALLWFFTKRVDKIHWFTLALLIIFGSTTLLTHDPRYLQWKPSVVNWLFAIILLGSHFIGKKTAIQYLLANKLMLTRKAWRTLNMMWALFFIFSGIINLYVALNFSESFWVQFKLFGQLLITLGFLIIQSLYLYQQIKYATLKASEGELES